MSPLVEKSLTCHHQKVGHKFLFYSVKTFQVFLLLQKSERWLYSAPPQPQKQQALDLCLWVWSQWLPSWLAGMGYGLLASLVQRSQESWTIAAEPGARVRTVNICAVSVASPFPSQGFHFPTGITWWCSTELWIYGWWPVWLAWLSPGAACGRKLDLGSWNLQHAQES